MLLQNVLCLIVDIEGRRLWRRGSLQLQLPIHDPRHFLLPQQATLLEFIRGRLFEVLHFRMLSYLFEIWNFPLHLPQRIWDVRISKNGWPEAPQRPALGSLTYLRIDCLVAHLWLTLVVSISYALIWANAFKFVRRLKWVLFSMAKVCLRACLLSLDSDSHI